MKEYERLTKKDKNGFVEFEKCEKCDYCGSAGCYSFENGINRLAELEDKIENGTLIELPCKIGDVFYYASQLKNKIEKHIVTGFEISNELRIRTISDCYSTGNYVGYFYSSYFNKTLFKTKIEAEKKLEELKNENTRKQQDKD